MDTWTRTRSLAITLLTTAILAACGGAPASSDAPAGSGAAPGSDPAASSGSTVPSSPPSADVDVCGLLTSEEVEELTGYPIKTATPGPHMGILENGCEWELDTGEAGSIVPTINAGVKAPGGRAYFDSYFAILVGDEFMPAEAVDGLGDDAIYQEDADSYVVVKGDTMVDFTTFSFGLWGIDGGRELEEELVLAILSKL